MDNQILTKQKMNNIEVFNILKKLGIKTSNIGTKYILSAIRIGYYSNNYSLHMEEIYHEVSKIFNVAPKTIKNGITYSLNRRNDSVSRRNFQTIFGYEYDEYTFMNKEFIEEIIRIINMRF